MPGWCFTLSSFRFGRSGLKTFDHGISGTMDYPALAINMKNSPART